MNAAAALGRLWALGKPVLTTDDAALAVGVERSAASHMLKRLAGAGLMKRIRHGLWTTDLNLDPLLLPEHLTAPFPSYISFQSALFFHGMVSQIPTVIFVASLAQTRRVQRPPAALVYRFGSQSARNLALAVYATGQDTTPDRLGTMACPIVHPAPTNKKGLVAQALSLGALRMEVSCLSRSCRIPRRSPRCSWLYSRCAPRW